MHFSSKYYTNYLNQYLPKVSFQKDLLLVLYSITFKNNSKHETNFILINTAIDGNILPIYFSPSINEMTQVLQLSFFPDFRPVTEGDFFSASDFESADTQKRRQNSEYYSIQMGNEVSKWNFHTSLVFQRRTNKLSPTPQKNFSTCVHAVQCHSSSIPIELCCAMAIDRFLKITTLRGVFPW